MAGYSGTPLARKLGIRPGARVVLVSAPDGAEALLEPLPDGARAERVARGEDVDGAVDVALVYCTWAAELATAWPPVRAALAPAGGLWVAWPKKAAKVPTDLTEDPIRAFGLAQGLVDNKVCAVDETWSGLRFVIRLVDRKS